MDETKVTVEGQGAGAENATGAGNSQGHGEAEKTYTKAELDAEVDRRVTEGVKTARAKWQTEYEEKLQAEKDEAARLAKMSAEEREKAKFEKERKQFDTERTAYQKEKLEYECAKQLAAQNLDVSFAAMLTGSDAETTKSNIDTFKAAFSKAVEASVTDRLKGKAPKMANSEGGDSFFDNVRRGAGLK